MNNEAIVISILFQCCFRLLSFYLSKIHMKTILLFQLIEETADGFDLPANTLTQAIYAKASIDLNVLNWN